MSSADGEQVDVNGLLQGLVAQQQAAQRAEAAAWAAVPDHPHALTCSACGKEVTGRRYRCLICEDYEICRDCERLGEHPLHVLVLIRQPGNWETCEPFCKALRDIGGLSLFILSLIKCLHMLLQLSSFFETK